MLITSLKSALEEQEETMQSQDVVIQNKEEEIGTLSKGGGFFLGVVLL